MLRDFFVGLVTAVTALVRRASVNAFFDGGCDFVRIMSRKLPSSGEKGGVINLLWKAQT